MKYVVYVTKNLKSKVNGINRIYAGVHETENPDIFDGYLGESCYRNQPNTFMYPKTPFQVAVKKYGVEAFHRTILAVFDNKDEAYKYLAEVANKTFIAQTHTYNSLPIKDVPFPIFQFDLDGNLKKKWNDGKELLDFYGIPIERFGYVIKSKYSFLNSFWSYYPSIEVKDYNPQQWKGNSKIVHLYSLSGKHLREFLSANEAAEHLNSTWKEVTEAIKNQRPIGGYYVSNSITDLFIPKPRRQYLHTTYYVYKVKDGEKEFLGKYEGKAVMNVIGLHSWTKISNIFSINNNWYQDFYISLKPLDISEVPDSRPYNPTYIDVYDKYGNFIESLTIKEVKEKYNVPNAKIKNIQQGNKFFGDNIFKYHSK